MYNPRKIKKKKTLEDNSNKRFKNLDQITSVI